MASARVIAIKTLAEFSKQIESLLKGSRAKTPKQGLKVMNWYRGHSRATQHKLVPGLYRHPAVKDIDGLVALEISMMDEFRRQGLLHSYHQPANGSPDLISMLFYMQHHGVPTRLLDWTSNPFIALYFALSGARKNDSGEYDDSAAVWVLDPFRWNRHALQDMKWGDEGPVRDSIFLRLKERLPSAF